MFRIYLFGTLRALDGESALPPPNPPKVLALWAFLLLRRDQAIPRDQVAFALWPDVTEAEARANLRRHLHLLRTYLPQTTPVRPWFIADRDLIAWNRQADYWLDVQEFQKAATDARRTGDGVSTRESTAQLQSAIDYYSGDLLENLYDDWVLLERERFRQQYAEMLEHLAYLQEAIGDWRGAIGTAERLLSHDRMREENYRLAMRLCYLAGDRAAALRHFDACRRILREDLDVEPMPDTLKLRDAIANGTLPVPIRTLLPVPVSSPLIETSTLQHLIATEEKPTRIFFPRRAGTIAILLIILIASLLAAWAVSNDLLAPTETLTLTGDAVTQDTWITVEQPDALFDPAYPDDWFKDYTQVHLQFYDSDLDRFLIRFDMRALPTNAKIERAELRDYLETWTAEEGRHALQRAYPATVSAFRIRHPWQPERATYNTPWTAPGLAPGVDYDAQPLASQTTSGTTWLALDVTTAAREWAIFPDSNWGMMLKITDAPEGVAHYWVDTSDHGSPARRPQLVITYRAKSQSRPSPRTMTLTDAEIADTWITSSLPRATSAASLRGQSASQLVWVTDAFKGIALPPGKDALDIPFEQFPRARLNKAGQTLSHVLFKFDLARLPANAHIEQGMLAVFLEPASFSLPPLPTTETHNFTAIIGVYRLLRAWQPQTVAFGFPWKETGLAPGVDYDTKPLATRRIRGATWLTFDITTGARAWQSGANHGLILTVDEAPEGMAPFWMPTVEYPKVFFHPEVRILFQSE